MIVKVIDRNFQFLTVVPTNYQEDHLKKSALLEVRPENEPSRNDSSTAGKPRLSKYKDASEALEA